jgi:hypothetical protein
MWPLDLGYSLAKWANHGNDLMTPYTTWFLFGSRVLYVIKGKID